MVKAMGIEITKRILCGHRLIGYMILDTNKFSKERTISLDQFKELAKAGKVNNYILRGENIRGINGFKLRDIPVVQYNYSQYSVIQLLSWIVAQDIDGFIRLKGAIIETQTMYLIGGKIKVSSIHLSELKDIIDNNTIEVKDRERVRGILANFKIDNGYKIINALEYGTIQNRKIKINRLINPSDMLVEELQLIINKLKKHPLIVTKIIEYGDIGGVTVDEQDARERTYLKVGEVLGYEIYNCTDKNINIGEYSIQSHSRLIIGRTDLPKLNELGILDLVLNAVYKSKTYQLLSITFRINGEYERIQAGIKVGRGKNTHWELKKDYSRLKDSLDLADRLNDGKSWTNQTGLKEYIAEQRNKKKAIKLLKVNERRN